MSTMFLKTPPGYIKGRNGQLVKPKPVVIKDWRVKVVLAGSDTAKVYTVERATKEKACLVASKDFRAEHGLTVERALFVTARPIETPIGTAAPSTVPVKRKRVDPRKGVTNGKYAK